MRKQNISRRRRSDGNRIDRLSELDNNLLNHLLTLVHTKQAARTTILSKRWKNLYNDLPCLTFEEDRTGAEQLIDRIRRTLRRRNVALTLHALLVRFEFEKRFTPGITAWFNRAIQCGVKRLRLELLRDDNSDDVYQLPQSVLSCTTFTSMYLQHCTVKPYQTTTISWIHLTDLTICGVELKEPVIQKILSGCPVLGKLSLEACFGFERLEINNSPSLLDLTVEDDVEKTKEPSSLEISAPNVDSLSICSPFIMEKRKVRLENMRSLKRTDVVLSAIDFRVSDGEVITETNRFFEEIKHVKELNLRCNSKEPSNGSECLEAIFRLTRVGLPLPKSARICLTIDASRNENSFSGILALLESSPNLETLFIQSFDTFENEEDWGPVERTDLACDLPRLREVELINYGNPNLGGEPMLTMARTLLKRATALKKMVVESMVSFDYYEDDEDSSSSVATNVSEKLHSFPISSQHVSMKVSL